MTDHDLYRLARAKKAYGREPKNLDEVFNCVLATAQVSATKRKAAVVGLQWDIDFRPLVSNSHNAPVGYKDNFGWKDHLPKGYRGFFGRVWLRTTKYNDWGCSVLEHSLLHTGTGGGGAYDGPWATIERAQYQAHHAGLIKRYEFQTEMYSWDCKLWLSDWPELENWLNQEETLAILMDKPFAMKHRMIWEDPAQKITDAELMAEWAIQRNRMTV